MQKVTEYRPRDYAYDPAFIVSGAKDRYRAAIMGRLANAKYQICPIFVNMFSDMSHYPNKQFLRVKTAPLPRNKYAKSHKVTFAKDIDVDGADRYKFNFPLTKANKNGFTVPQLPITSATSVKTDLAAKVKRKRKKVGTMYRESSAQTSPWEPSYKVVEGEDPELLKLDFLKWGSGLPAGMHEIKLIERARMKRAWQENFEAGGLDDLEKNRGIISAMERDEWAFREQEIQDVQNLRLELLQMMLSQLHLNAKNRVEAKLNCYIQVKQKDKEEKLDKLKKATLRELRKINLQESGIEKKYRVVDQVREHIDVTSEIYGPQVRFGEHPKRWHHVVDDSLKRYKPKFEGVEDLNTLPNWLDDATKIKDCACLNLPGTRLCIRETKWTKPVLKELHDTLKALRSQSARQTNHLRTIVETSPYECSTPEVDGISDRDEDFYQALVLYQAVIKGRASQTIIYEGRDRCRQLIKELKLSAGLFQSQNNEIYENKLAVKLRQREEHIERDKVLKLQENLDRLQGSIVGSLLDFLNKELRRLQEERRAHAMCILLERERFDREAAEAGRRQTELRRRREHDEMFKQTVKIHQETVDLYFNDILMEGADFASEEEAREFVTKMAIKLDEEAVKRQSLFGMNEYDDDDEELVADLVHHFVLPEVEKQTIRKKIARKQKEKLRTVHNAVYEELQETSDLHWKMIDDSLINKP